MNHQSLLLGISLISAVGVVARGDLLVSSDGNVREGKLIAQGSTEFVWRGAGETTNQHLTRATVNRLVVTDEHGAATAVIPANPAAATSTAPAKEWTLPVPPTAPPIVALKGSTYYLIPLHGEVGGMVFASALEESLADAAARKPTVVVLDIDSPGGLVEETKKIAKVLHQYNKTLRIIALTDQDLSAAAVFTLSVRHIYVKSSSIIGAATSFVPGQPEFSAKIEEKMQSAWRAVARNSAEEGEHDPLLADAMIDNDLELHLETDGGKNVIKTGPGDRMLCRKGKVLTLTSHEAVACGLADGEADDLQELGTALGMKDWTECKGLGSLLADYLPKRAAAFSKEFDRVIIDLRKNLQEAASNDPTSAASRLGAMPFFLPANASPAVRDRVQQAVNSKVQGDWNQRSLACVVAMQKVEGNLGEAIEICNAFKQDARAEAIKGFLEEMAQYRAGIYDSRNKFQGQTGKPATPPAESRKPAGSQPPAALRFPAVSATQPQPRPVLLATPAEERQKLGYSPTPRTAHPGIKDPATVEEAQTMLHSTKDAEAMAAALWLRDAPFDESKRKEVIKALAPHLDDPDPNKRPPFVEAIANWAVSEDVPLLVKVLETPEDLRADSKPDGNLHCWGAAAHALLYLDPAALERLIPERKVNNWWRVSVYWVLLAVSKDEGVASDPAKKLMRLAITTPQTRP